MWQFPPSEDARFVCAMEGVLEVYHQVPDPSCPLICVDEASVQLLEHARAPRPCAPGQAAREDNEYVRGGTAAIFVAFAPTKAGGAPRRASGAPARTSPTSCVRSCKRISPAPSA